MDEAFDIVIVGAGIAGLVAAITASEGGARVALVEAHSPGGRARTTEREGYRYNVGPHALYLRGHLLPFLATRGMDPPGGVPDATHVRLIRDAQLWPLSASPMDLARTKLLSPRSRVRFLSLMARLGKADTTRWVGTPWAEWLGNEPDDVAAIMQMFVRTGTYVNAPARFDAAAALDQFKLARGGVRYLDGGWQTMVDAMLACFTSHGGHLITSTVLSVEAQSPGAIVTTTDAVLTARAVILAGLAPQAVQRLTGATIAGLEHTGRAVGASVLDIALRREHAGLVFGIDEPLYLSPHAPTAQLAPTAGGLVSVLRYTPDDELAPMAPEAVRGRLEDLAAQAGIRSEDIVHTRYLHHLVVANGFPAAAAGGLAGRPRAEALDVAGVFIAGDWVGPRYQLADAASASGEDAALAALRHVSRHEHARL
jgi:phytoene dehydrogenase-like protein